MIHLITDLFDQLIINDNGVEVLLNALQENVLDYSEFMEIICTITAEEENDTITNQLADILAKVLFEKKSLHFIENKIANDQSLMHFWKKCLWKIGELIGETNTNDLDESFTLFNFHYIRLITKYYKP